MNVTDLIIIYLACGAPFGVYQITTHKSHSLTDKAVMLLSFVLWPGYALALLVKRFRYGRNRHFDFSKAGLDEIRCSFERIAFTDATTASLFGFREVFYRFTGLAEVVAESQSFRASYDIFDLSGHKNRKIASRCLDRSNRQRVAFHHDRAQRDFVDLICKLAENESRRAHLITLASALGESLGNERLSVDITVGISDLYESAPEKLIITGQTFSQRVKAASI